MTPRRNPFESPEPVPTAASTPSIYDSLRVANPRKRNRQWERQHQDQKVVYRGIDSKLAQQIRTVSDKLRVPAGEVARALIEHALRAYAEGDLSLVPRPNPLRLRMTLFPSSTSAPRKQTAQVSTKSKPAEAAWRVVTTWRGFPQELKHEIAALASEEGLGVPVGELVSALLRYGLKAYEGGVLKLEPVQKTMALTLIHGGES